MSKFDSYDAFSTTSATFSVVVDGQTLGRFLEASGLEVQVDVFEVKEGGQNFFVHKLPGRFSFPNLTLKRGVTADLGMLAWIDKTTAGAFEAEGKKLKRNTVALVLSSAKGDPLRTWTFYDAFPVRWSGPNFTANSDDFLVEELEIAHHGFSVKDDNPSAKAAKKAAKKAPAKKPAKKAPAKKAAPAKKPAKKTASKGPAFKGQKKAAKSTPSKGPAYKGQAPAKKAPAKKSQPRYMDSTESSRAKQKPPAKKAAKKAGGR